MDLSFPPSSWSLCLKEYHRQNPGPAAPWGQGLTPVMAPETLPVCPQGSRSPSAGLWHHSQELPSSNTLCRASQRFPLSPQAFQNVLPLPQRDSAEELWVEGCRHLDWPAGCPRCGQQHRALENPPWKTPRLTLQKVVLGLGWPWRGRWDAGSCWELFPLICLFPFQTTN